MKSGFTIEHVIFDTFKYILVDNIIELNHITLYGIFDVLDFKDKHSIGIWKIKTLKQ